MSTTTTVTQSPVVTAETIRQLFPDIDSSSDALSGHDAEQIRLMDEVCIVTDNDDLPIGNLSKKICTLPPAETPTRCSSRDNLWLLSLLANPSIDAQAIS